MSHNSGCYLHIGTKSVGGVQPRTSLNSHNIIYVRLQPSQKTRVCKKQNIDERLHAIYALLGVRIVIMLALASLPYG